MTIDHEPFGRLAWKKAFWAGRSVLPGWAGFQTRLGPYAHLSSAEPSDGTAGLNVGAEWESRRPPVESQERAFRHLVENEPALTRAVQEAILAEYPRLRAMYGHDGDRTAEIMPDVVSVSGLRPLIGLSTVHVLEAAKDGLAYIGFELGCNWDEEHGLGVMTHAGRVVKVGQADISFQVRAAERDIQESAGGGHAVPPSARPAPPAAARPRKRWWEFWK